MPGTSETESDEELEIPVWMLVAFFAFVLVVWVYQSLSTLQLTLLVGGLVLVLGTFAWLALKRWSVSEIVAWTRGTYQSWKEAQARKEQEEAASAEERARQEELARRRKLRRELYSGRKSKLKTAVGLRCEIPACSVQTNLHVHHITPIAEGGDNSLRNLIVLCRNHHGHGDTGSFSRTDLRTLTRRDNRFKDESFVSDW